MMSARAPSSWFPRLLFWLVTAGALLLISLVLLAPWLDDGTPRLDGQTRLLALFARDATVRRTAIGSAIGLLVTVSLALMSAAIAPSLCPIRNMFSLLIFGLRIKIAIVLNASSRLNGAVHLPHASPPVSPLDP